MSEDRYPGSGYGSRMSLRSCGLLGLLKSVEFISMGVAPLTSHLHETQGRDHRVWFIRHHRIEPDLGPSGSPGHQQKFRQRRGSNVSIDRERLDALALLSAFGVAAT